MPLSNEQRRIQKEVIDSLQGEGGIEALEGMTKRLHLLVNSSEFIDAHNLLIDMLYGMKLIHGALDFLSDVEQAEKVSGN